MHAIHFICRRDDNGDLKNVFPGNEAGMFRSGNWDLSPADAACLLGGWLYLHPVKASPSEFGGIIQGFERVDDHSVARSERLVLIVQGRPQGGGQKWRGRDHGMAYSSGLVNADLPHEKKA